VTEIEPLSQVEYQEDLISVYVYSTTLFSVSWNPHNDLIKTISPIEDKTIVILGWSKQVTVISRKMA
jgi:hypothetical protein